MFNRKGLQAGVHARNCQDDGAGITAVNAVRDNGLIILLIFPRNPDFTENLRALRHCRSEDPGMTLHLAEVMCAGNDFLAWITPLTKVDGAQFIEAEHLW